jgi:cephalosporin hydroxylase
MKKFEFGIDWRFCPECQKIQRSLHEFPEDHQINEWETCVHDYRQNSAKAVLENQAKELEEMGRDPYKVRTYQSPRELESFLSIAYHFGGDIETAVEIGSFHGGTISRIAQFFAPELQTVISIDRTFDFWFADDLYCIKIKGESTAKETIKHLENALNGKQIDLLFIDGDHSYAGEMADYKNYSPFVRDGGIIALHDTHSIHDVGRVFAEIPGKVKIDIFSYQGIGLVVK